MPGVDVAEYTGTTSARISKRPCRYLLDNYFQDFDKQSGCLVTYPALSCSQVGLLWHVG